MAKSKGKVYEVGYKLPCPRCADKGKESYFQKVDEKFLRESKNKKIKIYQSKIACTTCGLDLNHVMHYEYLDFMHGKVVEIAKKLDYEDVDKLENVLLEEFGAYILRNFTPRKN